jgi:hypothetical protein
MRNGDDARPKAGEQDVPTADPQVAAALPQQERRQFPRIQLAVAVELRFASPEAALESSTVDISEGGVFIRMPNPRPEGTPIQIGLHVGGRRLSIGGVVVRCVRPGEGAAPGIGVLFTDLRPDDAAFVKTLVRERLSQ